MTDLLWSVHTFKWVLHKFDPVGHCTAQMGEQHCAPIVVFGDLELYGVHTRKEVLKPAGQRRALVLNLKFHLQDGGARY